MLKEDDVVGIETKEVVLFEGQSALRGFLRVLARVITCTWNIFLWHTIISVFRVLVNKNIKQIKNKM